MRVLLVHNFYQSSAPSGEDVVFRMEAELLRRHGQDVITYKRENDDIGRGLADRLDAARDLFWSQRSYREIRGLIQRFRPDVAHFHNTFPLVSTSGYRACRDARVPVVQTLHNYRLLCAGALLLRNGKPCEDCIGHLPIPAILHGCYRQSRVASALLAGSMMVNRARHVYTEDVDRYLCLTDFARERFVSGGLPVGKLFVKPNALLDPPDAGMHGDGYCLFVGRLSAEKGIRTLVEAWVGQTLPLKIVGDGALREELEARARQSNARVEFLGFRDKQDVYALMGAAKVLIIPSECYEGFPVTVLEGLASGAPMLVSRIGALDELLDDPANCRKFQPGIASSLAETLESMFGDPDHLADMRIRNRALFEQRYSPVAVMDQQLEHYRAVAAVMHAKQTRTSVAN
jgi:glycosyltransferase involved in cell wall biosynthesis